VEYVDVFFSVSLNTNIFKLFVALSFATCFFSYCSGVKRDLHNVTNCNLCVLYYRIDYFNLQGKFFTISTGTNIHGIITLASVC
jgi:hypothetical protein